IFIQFLRCLLLLAVVARGMVPAGFMPAFAAQPGQLFPLVICSGATGSATVYVTGDQLPVQDDGGEHPQPHQAAPCAYDASFTSAVPLTPPQMPAPLFAPEARKPPAPTQMAEQTLSKNYDPQGPPVFRLHR
ncbi:MAG TPA: hypothetical protein VEF76_04095, partial [Patescibacteria group bacterium]|nr:hypothetical protein [Patescibacteria group bacterium]